MGEADLETSLGRAQGLQQKGNFEEARDLYLQLLDAYPEHPLVLHYLGLVMHQLKLFIQSNTYLRRSLELSPRNSSFWRNYVVCLWQQGMLPMAYEAVRKLIALEPADAEVQRLAAKLCQEMQDEPKGYLHLGMWHYLQQDLPKALVCFQKVVELEPESVNAHYNVATCYYEMMDLGPAEEFLRKTIALDPDHGSAHWNLALLLLLLGRYEEGWKEYLWRWKSQSIGHTARHFKEPSWAGEALSGKTLMLYAEQGLGDAIQFARYIPLIDKQGGRIIVECQEGQGGLFSRLAHVDAVYPIEGSTESFDYQLPLLSLPYVFKTTLETIPHDVPYLSAPENSAIDLSAYTELPIKVGLVWGGQPAHGKDAQRSIPLAQLTPLLKLPNIAFFSLQKGEQAAELQKLDLPLIDLNPVIKDFDDTAAIMQQLDLMISVDTAPVHLAGALGRPIWLMDRFFPDWRWLLDREDSPWYPSLKIFRQSRSAHWDDVIAKVTAELRREFPTS